MFKSIDKIYLATLLFIAVLFNSFLAVLKGYPTINDFPTILKISSLDGQGKWINGFFGPGYTYLSIFLQPKIINFATFYAFLILIAAVFTFSLNKNLALKLPRNEKKFLYLVSVTFFLIFLSRLGFNYSDGIFLLILYIGLIIFIHGTYFKGNHLVKIFGSIILGISTLFRNHGIIFLFILLLLWTYSTYKKYRNGCPANWAALFFMPILFSLIPILASYFYIHTLSGDKTWQLFNLYKFIYGVDWLNIHSIIQSDHYKNFPENLIYSGDWPLVLSAIKASLIAATKELFPFLFIIFLVYLKTKKKIHLVLMLLILCYILIILPGWERGYYPVILFTLASLSISSKEIMGGGRIKLIIFAILTWIALSSSISLSKLIKGVILNYIEVETQIKPVLFRNKIDGPKNIFTDDFNLYIPGLSSESYLTCNFLGWVALHPKFSDYDAIKIMNGHPNKFCDVRALVISNPQLIDTLKKRGGYSEVVVTRWHTIFVKLQMPNEESNYLGE